VKSDVRGRRKSKKDCKGQKDKENKILQRRKHKNILWRGAGLEMKN
jgi:hypothetical protein